MKHLCLSLFCLLAVSLNALGADANNTRTITDFSIPGEWKPSKWSTAEGRIAVRPEVPPALKKEDPSLEESLGIKIDWPGGEGMRLFALTPASDIKIPFVLKELSLWVNGSGTEHFCEIIVDDASGQRQKIGLGKVNFQGWKNITKKMPPNIMQPVTITGITFHDWNNPQPGETTLYLSRFDVTIDPEAKMTAAKNSAATDTNDSW